jgi:hypothetical protein
MNIHFIHTGHAQGPEFLSIYLSMWQDHVIHTFLESYNGDFIVESKTIETPKASYLLGNITF